MLCNIDASPIYPCVYREHASNPFGCLTNAGLSLCIQGTSYKLLHCCCNSRFIPVCTGNTFINLIGKNIVTVYPCVYREHVIIFVRNYSFKRFIPVCTGNTNGSCSVISSSTVYPCVYREHINSC